MSDIVERLRETIVAHDVWHQGRLKTTDTLLERFSRERKEAADAIEALRAENARLREALKLMIDTQDEWERSVAKVIGKQPDVFNRAIDAARAAMGETE